jgi:hypothetical protein
VIAIGVYTKRTRAKQKHIYDQYETRAEREDDMQLTSETLNKFFVLMISLLGTPIMVTLAGWFPTSGVQ